VRLEDILLHDVLVSEIRHYDEHYGQNHKKNGQPRRGLLKEICGAPGAEGGLGRSSPEGRGEVPAFAGLYQDDADEQQAVQDE